MGVGNGNSARPMESDWVRAFRDQCEDAGVSFFFKQWGGVRKSASSQLDNRTHDAIPPLSPHPISQTPIRTGHLRRFELQLAETL